MKKRRLTLLLICMALALTACTDVEPAQKETQTPKPSETVSEPVSEPVTRADYPLEFLPGLGAAGVIPDKCYHIGIVIGASSPYAANFETFEQLGQAYEDAFDMTVTVEQPDEAAQMDCVAQLLDDGIELLIFAPGGSEPFGEVDVLCTQKGVPYITIGRRTEAMPGEGGYVCTIEPDDFLSGILTGQSIADTITAQYGEPFGNIAEITGVVSDKTSILRSSGLQKALSAHGRLNVVCSVAGNGDKETVYKAAENIFKACREGELDAIVVPDDDAAITVLQAALDYDRNDVAGKIWSTGATEEGLTGVYYGQIVQTIETASQSGMAAMEYAVHYLNGDRDLPSVITSLTRAFTADSQEKKDAIKNMIAALKESGSSYCLESLGDYALFLPQSINEYPQRYDLYTDTAAYLAAFEPYITQRAVYRQNEETDTEAQ